MKASYPLKEPRIEQKLKHNFQKGLVSKTFKKDTQPIITFLDDKNEEEKEAIKKELESGKAVFKIGEKDFEITADMLKIEQVEEKIYEEKFTPSVIEPSFGIGRIIYCIFEHCFKVREHDAQWTYFDFPPQVAPIKCFILPLTGSEYYKPFIDQVRKNFSNFLFRQGH